jgi:predicted RNA-binding protein YlqC (UPF0109 family)
MVPTVTTDDGGGTTAAVVSSNGSPSNNVNINRRGKKKPKETVPVIQLPEETTDLYKKLGKMLPFDNMTVTIYIPTGCAGAVIGKKGSTIAKIQKWAQQMAGIHSDQVRISVVHHPQSPMAGNGALGGEGCQLQSSPSLRGMTTISSAEESGATKLSAVGNIGNPATGLSSSNFPSVIPFTYTELDFSDPNWTPVVIRAPTMAGMVVSATILDICLEYVLDRTQIQFIFDLPISSQNQQAASAASATNSNSCVINNAHATIIGKRGQTIMTLSANSNCRIMVPPKQLKHDIIQLEGPLKECTCCLEAIANLLSSSLIESSSNAPSKSNKSAVATAPSSSTSQAIAKNAQIRSNDNKHQCSFVVRPLPSQTKLRNIARRTETVIRKTRRNKGEYENAMPSQVEKKAMKQHADASGDASTSEEETMTPAEGENSIRDFCEGVCSGVPWQLTIMGSSTNQVRAAWKRLEMFKIADVPEETNITMNFTQGHDGDVDEDYGDEMSAAGGGENEESTDRCFSESGDVGSSPPSSGIVTPSKLGSGIGGRGGAGSSGNRGGRRSRSNK